MIEGDLMANICNYEIHAKGNKKAVLFFYTTLQTLDYKQITHKEGNDDEYILWIKGNCKWSLDYFCEEKKNVVIQLNEFDEDTILDERIGFDYWYLTMRQKSEILNIEILAHSWSDESQYDQFDHYKDGNLLSSKYEEYSNYYPWDKSEFSTYEAFCKAYNINPIQISENLWYEDDEDIFYCDTLPSRNISTTKFKF